MSPKARQELRFEGLSAAVASVALEVQGHDLVSSPVFTIAAGGRAVVEGTGEEQAFAPEDEEELKKRKEQTAKAAALAAEK